VKSDSTPVPISQHQASISSTLFEQFLPAQIPKAPKSRKSQTHLRSALEKAAHRTLLKLTPGVIWVEKRSSSAEKCQGYVYSKVISIFFARGIEPTIFFT